MGGVGQSDKLASGGRAGRHCARQADDRDRAAGGAGAREFVQGAFGGRESGVGDDSKGGEGVGTALARGCGAVNVWRGAGYSRRTT